MQQPMYIVHGLKNQKSMYNFNDNENDYAKDFGNERMITYLKIEIFWISQGCQFLKLP